MSFINSKPISRRALLRGSAAGAGVAIGLPFLDVMAPRRAAAQTAPRRFVCFMKPNGMSAYRADPFGNPDADNWTPKITGPNYQMTPLWAGWSDLKADFTVVTGAHNRIIGSNGLAHSAQTTLLTPYDYIRLGDGNFNHTAGGRSMDQYLADRIGQGTRFASLETGAFMEDLLDGFLNKYMSFSAARMPNPPEHDASKVWTRLFSQGIGGTGDPAAIERLRTERKSVLDAVKTSVDLLKKRVGAEDRARLDQHFTSVRSIEARITETATTTPACRAPAKTPFLPQTTQYLADIVKNHLDLIVMALTCDLTRVATFMLQGGNSDTDYRFLGCSLPHHTATHGGPRDQTDKIDTWQMTQAAYLVRNLKNVREGAGTLLDRTTVLISSDSASGWNHNSGGYYWGGDSQPKGAPLDWAYIIAGAPDYFRHGSHIRYKPGMVYHDQIVRSVYESVTGLSGAASAAWMQDKYRGEPAPALRGDKSTLTL